MARSDPPRVALDACAWLSIIKGEPTAEFVRPLLQQMSAGEVRPVGSTLLLTEIYKPSNDSRTQQKQSQILQMLEAPQFDLIDVSARIAREAAQLRLAHGFRTADAIHLATAKLGRATWFVTMDSELHRKEPQLVGTAVFLVTERSEVGEFPWSKPVQEPLIPAPVPSNVLPFRSQDG